MGGFDPLAPVYQAIIAWSDDLDVLLDLAPFAVLLSVKLVLLALALGMLVVSFTILADRLRAEARRVRSGQNGAQQIMSAGRIRLAVRFQHTAWVILAVAVFKVLAPQPVRPSITVDSIVSVFGTLYVLWQFHETIRDQDATDRATAAEVRRAAPHIPALLLEDEVPDEV